MQTPNDYQFNNSIGTPSPGDSSKLGLIGLVIGIAGLVIFCAPLSIAFVMGATGNAPDSSDPLIVGISLIAYCGVFISLIGATLGGISLARGENKTFGIVSIALGALILCACGFLFIIGIGVGG